MPSLTVLSLTPKVTPFVVVNHLKESVRKKVEKRVRGGAKKVLQGASAVEPNVLRGDQRRHHSPC
jgi:hypothetical protein